MFDNASEYDALLAEGLKVSGEDKQFFIEGRVNHLAEILSSRNMRVQKVLDYGCGTGATSPYLADRFQARVCGVDLSKESVVAARQSRRHDAVTFSTLGETLPKAQFDLCYVNGVFHHIVPQERAAAMQYIHGSLTGDGVLAFFENNPWNPGTRWIMSRIPFDKDAITLSYLEGTRLLENSGFELIMPPQFLFYFPGFLRGLRPMEAMFTRIPLGAQYLLLAKKRRT